MATKGEDSPSRELETKPNESARSDNVKRRSSTVKLPEAKKATRPRAIRFAQPVDFDQASDTRWGEVSLLTGLGYPDQDRLIGWATHVSQDDAPTPWARQNPLAGSPNGPLPPSFLRFFIQRHGERQMDKDPELTQSIAEKFDNSSLVALGTVLEDQLTSSLMPLARLHVERCRRLERMDDPSLFEAWTLPPDEALHLLAFDPNTDLTRAVLSTAVPPTREQCPDRHEEMDSEGSERDTKTSDEWCKSRKQTLLKVRRNMDIFNLLLQAPPSTLGGRRSKDVPNSSNGGEEAASDNETGTTS